MADVNPDAQEQLAEILEPLLGECIDMFEESEELDTGVMADNLATALIERGIVVPPQTGRPMDDIPTGEYL